MKSFMANPSNIERKWFVVDAADKTLGRLAAEVAKVLRGKHKPTFTPHMDTGDHVIIINADKVVLTGKKLTQKIYFRHSGYLGGDSYVKAGDMLKNNSVRMVELAVVTYNATGRRKSSVARVRLVPGEGNIVINDRELNQYFGLKTLELIVNQPLEITETKGKYDVLVNVNGGGISGQAGAIRHGIARALLKVDAEFRPALKKAGFLTRDPREKELLKYGLKKARKASQFSKR